MTDKKTKNTMLEDSALENVTGGKDAYVGKCHFYKPVDKDHGVIGQNYYVVNNRKQGWFYGTLLRSYEKNILFGLVTRRTHDFHIIVREGNEVDLDMTLSGDGVTLYTNMTKA